MPSHASRLTFIFSLAVGLGLGLYIGWIASPARSADTDPASLQQSYKDDYILMTAAIYSADDNLTAARARLAALSFNDPGSAVAAAAQRLISAQGPEEDLRRLAHLAAALNAVTPEMQPYLP